MKTTFTYGENTHSPTSSRPELSSIPPTREKAKQYFPKLEQEILTLTRLFNDSYGGSPSCDTEKPLFCIRAFNLYDGRAVCSGNYHSYSNAKRITEAIVKLLITAGKYQDDFLWHTPYYYCSPTCSQVFLLEAQRK